MFQFLEIFQYGFATRALVAGLIVAIIAPLIGIFLVLKRYSLIADSLAHVSLAGIAIGLVSGINPIFTALGATILASLGIERLRHSKKVYGETALAIFLSGSLALAIVLLSIGRSINVNVLNYLFGNILTVTLQDIYIISVLAIIVALTIIFLYRQLLYVTFDEDAAHVSGLPVKLINSTLIILSAITISLAIPIVGILLISALVVIPAVTALQLKKSFFTTLIYAEIFSLLSVVSGILLSFYLNLSTGGTIVLIMIIVFAIVFSIKSFSK